METLLKKVQTIEKTAQKLIEDTRQQHMEALRDLQSREEHMLAETRTKAQARSKKILQEQLALAEREINTIKQQGEQSTKMVHEAAQKNRSSTLDIAAKLFNETYIG